jgi:hypothetical protein
MWQLVKKDFFLYAILSIPLQLILSVAWLLTFKELNILVVIVQVLFVFLIIVVLTSHTEQVEEANHGYEFLKNLPITSLEIVGAKFFLIFATVVFLTLSNILLFILLGAGPGGLKLPVAFLIMTACIALILSALVHLGISTFGGDIFFVATSVLVAAAAILFTLLFEKKRLDINQIVKEAINYLQHGNMLVWILISLAIFLGLMIVAVWVRKTGMIGIIKRFSP